MSHLHSEGMQYSFGRITSVDGIAAKFSPSTPAFKSSMPLFLRGLATRYNKPHRFNDVIDIFLPGCFATTLVKGETVRLLDMHDEGACVATTNGGGLELFSDDTGLSFSAQLDRNSRTERLVAEVKSGSKRGMSVGYQLIDSHERIMEGERVRLISSARLLEISVVTAGAVRQAYVEPVDSHASPKRTTAPEADYKWRYAEMMSATRKLQEMLA